MSERCVLAHVFRDTHVDWVALADDGLPRKCSIDSDAV